MAKRLDQALVIDVESTCWAEMPPRGQVSEIVEIGICTVDLASLSRMSKRSIFVRPQSSEVSEFCTNLTGITAEMVANAPSLDDAVFILKHEYDAPHRLFASWGDYDRAQFQRNCLRYDIAYPFGPTHLNVKNLFSLCLGLPRELGLDAAYNQVGMTMDGVHHRGVDDAWNIAELLCLILRRMRRAAY